MDDEVNCVLRPGADSPTSGPQASHLRWAMSGQQKKMDGTT